jgi:hypothetical protein
MEKSRINNIEFRLNEIQKMIVKMGDFIAIFLSIFQGIQRILDIAPHLT